MTQDNGKSLATASMVLGIVGLVFTFFINGLIGLILGIIGLVLAGKAKQQGFEGSMRTAGFVMSLISVIAGVLMFVLALACVATIGAIGMSF
ncbi:hypothetical protein [Intestinimonas massiliensis (ex Afouda et al. 2020)]|uniref:hypothetical protein n=1 Tax=Intestinimonas massiliensis (ex Afouda et al. 2020) TaxID=1673721 RepID=UPI0010319AE4|nr:hypothetical protein [Intestinimonas massiliensis (ex Afouda et al. 2020)]